MTVIKQIVSRPECSVPGHSHAVARAKIAAHHYGCFTLVSPEMQRLLKGLERRKLILRRDRCRS